MRGQRAARGAKAGGMAERGRFELPVPVKVLPLSRRARSTTLPPLRVENSSLAWRGFWAANHADLSELPCPLGTTQPHLFFNQFRRAGLDLLALNGAQLSDFAIHIHCHAFLCLWAATRVSGYESTQAAWCGLIRPAISGPHTS